VAGVLVVYVAVVGEVHSLSRALAMALGLVLARAVQRPPDAVAVWIRALFVLLLSRPASLYSLGFQLSFTATLAVIVTARAWRQRVGPGRRRSIRRAFASVAATVAVGFSVVVVVAPLQLHAFGEMSVVGPLATLVLLPAVAAVLALAALTVVLAPIGGAAGACAALLGVLDRVVESAVVTAAAHAPDPLVLAPPHPVVYAAGLILVAATRRRPARLGGVALVVAAFAKSCGV
jgi:competence protein ComEC